MPPNETSAADSTLPPPAPMFLRTLAFLADSLVATLASALALKFLLPVFCPRGIDTVVDYTRRISEAYETALQEAVRGNAVSADAVNAIAAEAAQDATVVAFSETIFTIAFVVCMLYFTLSEQFLHGQTLGKKIFSLRTVIAGTTFPPRLLQTLSRSLWKTILLVPSGIILPILAIVNAHIVVFAKRHRGWHDKLARTEVIDDREPAHSSSEK